MIESLKKLGTARELLVTLTLRDIRVRYKQSILGIAWAILQPLSLMLVFTVFASLTGLSSGDKGIPYPIFVYCAVLPWTFFATAVRFAVPSLVTNHNLVTKTYFPREVMPMASIGACFVDFLVASVIFVGMMVFYRIPLRPTVLLVPVILTVQIVLTLAIALVGSAMNVFYRDIRYAIPLALQIWLFASPVMYSVDRVPQSFRWIYFTNPMAAIINAYREVILRGRLPDANLLLSSTAIAVGAAIVGYAIFKRMEMKFADVI